MIWTRCLFNRVLSLLFYSFLGISGLLGFDVKYYVLFCSPFWDPEGFMLDFVDDFLFFSLLLHLFRK